MELEVLIWNQIEETIGNKTLSYLLDTEVAVETDAQDEKRMRDKSAWQDRKNKHLIIRF